MKNKHIHITKDSDLLKAIYQKVSKELSIDSPTFGLRIWVKFLVYLTLIILSYVTLFLSNNTIVFFLSFIMYGITSVLFAFNFAHDFSHNTIFKSRKWNNICFILTYTLIGAHAEAWKKRHIQSHHYAPNVEGYDADLNITKLIRIVPGSDYYWYHRYQHIYAPFAYSIYSLFWIFIKDVMVLYTADEYIKSKHFMYYLSFWMQKITYFTCILLLPLLFSLQTWAVVLWGFLAMHLVQSLGLLFTFFMTHHVESTHYPTTNKDGNINTSWFMNQIKSSNDMHPFSALANFILGGFNCHIAHHLFPHYHHLHYPKLNRILYPILLENDIKPNQTSYLGGIISHWKLLKRMSLPS